VIKVRLGEIADIVSGGTPKSAVSDYWGGSVQWVTPADLSDLTEAYISTTPRTLTESGLRNCSAVVLPPGSVLLSSRAPIGHVAITGAPMATNQGFKSLVPFHDRADPKYLYHWLRANKALLQSLGNGATFKELSKAAVERIEVPLPPLEEQRRVAAILDQADTLRAKRRQILAHLSALTQSVLATVLSTAGSAQKIQLADVCTRVTDGTHQSPPWTTDGVPFLFVSNITSGEIDFNTTRFIATETWRELTRNSPIEEGDILYSSVGSYGNPVVVRSSRPFAFQRHIAHLKPMHHVMQPDFLAAQLDSPAIRNQARQAAKGVAQPTVNLSDIRRFELLAPPLEVQNEFAHLSARIRAERGRLTLAAASEKALFASLQSRAFRGDL
jgi:type I restriction enzyme S subunit